MTTQPAPIWTLDTVRPFWDAGLVPLPMRFSVREDGRVDKNPIVKGWADTPSEAWLVEAWRRPCAQVGLALRGSVVALDADSVADGDALCAALPEYPQQRSPYSGGAHVLGRIPAGRVAKNRTKRALSLPGGVGIRVDLRSEGGFVARYTLTPADVAEIPDFPPWVVAQISETRADEREAPRTESEALDRLGHAADTIEAAIPGTRSDTLCRWAWMVGRDVGAGLLPRDVARDRLAAVVADWGSQDKTLDTLERSLADGTRVPSRRVPGGAQLHVVNGKVKRDAASLRAILATVDALRWDSWEGRLVLVDAAPWGEAKGPWADTSASRCAAWICTEFELDYSSALIHEHATAIAQERPHVNALRDYLLGLRWDGVGRLDNALRAHFGDVSGPRWAFRKWAIAAVARALDPGCKVDSMLILSGPQGYGKSTFLRSLCPWVELFSDSPLRLDDPRDLPVRLATVWIYELAELASINRRDFADVRALLSSAVDDSVPKYGRNTIRRARHSVFCGTCNPDSRLGLDPGGMRRFWVVGVNAPGRAVADRDQIWAEAVAAYASGEAWHPDKAQESEGNEYAREYASDDDTWIGAIDAWAKGRPVVTMREVLTEVVRLPLERHTRQAIARARAALESLGYERDASAEGCYRRKSSIGAENEKK